jgi:hypothetical protein
LYINRGDAEWNSLYIISACSNNFLFVSFLLLSILSRDPRDTNHKISCCKKMVLENSTSMLQLSIIRKKRNRTFGNTGIESIPLYLTAVIQSQGILLRLLNSAHLHLLKDSKQDNIKFDTVFDAPSSTHPIDDRRHVTLYNY